MLYSKLLSSPYVQYSSEFQSEIMKALPQQWVTSFKAYEALGVYDIDDFISMAPLQTTHNESIVKLCVKYMLPNEIFYKYYSHGNNPKSILEAMFYKNKSHNEILDEAIKIVPIDEKTQMKFLQRYHVSFNKELLEITLNQCENPLAILEYFWEYDIIKEWKKEVIQNFVDVIKQSNSMFDAFYESASFNNPEIILSLWRI